MNTTEIAAQGARQELARRSLLDFAALVYPGFQAPSHLRYLAGKLEAVERGEIRRLLVTVAPGSGKSTLLQLFAAWSLGRDAARTIITTSAAAELGERNSRASRGYIAGDTWPFDARLSQDTSAQHRWNLTEGGGMFAIGAGGTITGWRANYCIIADDLQNSAGSQAERDGIFTWFREILAPRLDPGGAVVVIQTRWGEDDLPGQLLSSPDGAEWDYVRLPALAEDNDPLGRAPGEPLWPERWTAEEYDRRRVAMGSRAFETQYQSNPVALEGNLIKASWFKRYDKPPATFDRKILALDAAAKTGISNDYSVLVTLGVTEDALYVLDVKRRKVEFPDLVRMVVQAYDETDATAIYCEDASSGTQLIQALQRDTRLPIVPRKPVGSKTSRVEGITGTLEAGRVYLPNDAPWLLDLERELLAFPNGKHDDQVDALTLAISASAEAPVRVFGFLGSPLSDVFGNPTHNAWGGPLIARAS